MVGIVGNMIEIKYENPPSIGQTTPDGLQWGMQAGFYFSGGVDAAEFKQKLDIIKKYEGEDGYTHYYDYGVRPSILGKKRYDRIYASCSVNINNQKLVD